MKSLSVFSLLMLTALCCRGRIILPALVNSNMVLQQKATVKLWGKSTRKGSVQVITSWTNRQYKTIISKDSTWHINIATPPAGGPYNISLNDGVKLTLDNVLIGEVWFCSGQSNMEMPVRGWKNQPVKNSAELLLNAHNPNMRLFT
ncbi:hypothetical protein ABDD95_18465 [Mucilaginibacter sp. PAMB04274]|uniref:hypothetical protein n=1 Tax=Mucilaginibacter sp. PAMB04274 TaxID=3138568 RepID=UPI0031F6691B